jgi:hypothetical protein
VDDLFRHDEMHALKPEDTLPLDTPAVRMAMAKNAPAQTDAKSRLIARYVERFQLVTRGGLYVDGFAAPQSQNHPEAWTARRVLEINPPRLRTFWLCDIDPDGLRQLRDLQSRHNRVPPARRVFVMEGDFNDRYKEILMSRDEPPCLRSSTSETPSAIGRPFRHSRPTRDGPASRSSTFSLSVGFTDH